MKKLLTIIGILTVFCIGYVTGVNEPVAEAAPKKTQTFKNKHVTIKYIETKSGQFDLLIMPAKGYNITPEWDMQGNTNYKDAYLVGWNKKEAQTFHKKSKAKYKFTWDK